MNGKGGYVYIMSNKNRTVLYIGVTSSLYWRIMEHKDGVGSGFAKKYNCIDLIYFEFFPTIEEAIQNEKQLKKWKREWKDRLIKEFNPNLGDLTNEAKDML